MYRLSNFVKWDGKPLVKKAALIYTKESGYFFVNSDQRKDMEFNNKLYILIGVEK